MNNNFNPVISEEMFAAWLDGNISSAQDAYISQVCSADPDMREIIAADTQIEEYYDNLVETGYELPEEFLGDFDLPQIGETDHFAIDYHPDIEQYPGADADRYSNENNTNDSDDHYSLHDSDNGDFENHIFDIS